jgi:hypothetical protein
MVRLVVLFPPTFGSMYSNRVIHLGVLTRFFGSGCRPSSSNEVYAQFCTTDLTFKRRLDVSNCSSAERGRIRTMQLLQIEPMSPWAQWTSPWCCIKLLAQWTSPSGTSTTYFLDLCWLAFLKLKTSQQPNRRIRSRLFSEA